MDKQLLEEAKAAFASAQGAWDEAGGGIRGRAISTPRSTKARDAEGMAQDLVGRLGMQAG